MRPRRGMISATASLSVGVGLPSWVGAGTAANGVVPLTTLTLPSERQGGDLLLLLVQCDNYDSSVTDNPADNAYAGWTLVGRQPTSSSGAHSSRITVYYAWSQDISSAPTIAHTGGHQSAVIVAYRGINPANPFNAIAAGLNNTAATAVSMNVGVTTDVDNCRVVYVLTNNSDAVGTDWVGSVSNANLTDLHFSHSDRFNQRWNAGYGGGIAVVDGALATAGASGTTSATQNSVNSYRWVVVALEPKP